MTHSLYLTVLPAGPAGAPPTIFTPATPLRIPLGAGLAAAVRDADGELTTDDLVARDATAGMLWDTAATAMLDELGRITARHGTALQRRRVPEIGEDVWEIAAVGDPFPGPGLVAHPRLARHTHRVLETAGTPRIVVDGARLLALGPDAACPDVAVGLDISTGHCLQSA